MIGGVEAVKATEGIIALAALLALMYGPWQSFCTDYARQRMFNKRDQLFDVAMAGELDFASNEYQVTRTSINSMIRFAHEMTWLRILMLAWVSRKQTSWRPPVYDAVSAIKSRTVRLRVRAIVSEIETTAMIMVIAKSPFMLVFFTPLILIALVTVATRNLLRIGALKVGRVIQAEAALVSGVKVTALMQH